MGLVNLVQQPPSQRATPIIGDLQAILAGLEHVQKAANREQWGDTSSYALFELLHRIDCYAEASGHADISTTVRATEAFLEAEGLDGAVLTPGKTVRLELALQDLCAVLQGHIHNQTMAQTNEKARWALLIGNDCEEFRELAQHLRLQGWELSIVSSVAHAMGMMTRVQVTAVLIDIDGAGGLTLLRYLKNSLEPKISLIALSASGDLRTRLACLEAGAPYFFSRPADVRLLRDRLDELAGQTGADPYRVLIVTDDSKSAGAYRRALSAAGMETRISADPFDLFKALIDQQPELLLIDLAPTAIDTVNLIATLRQDNAFAHIPVVFAGAPSDAKRLWRAAGLGSHDVFAKPMAIESLLELIGARLGQHRALQRLITRDPLTGLMRKLEFNDRFETILGMMVRSKSALSVAFVDIDRLGALNAEHGYAAGDQALQAIARYLQRRLRYTDLIGRYEGGTFALLLPFAPMQAARVVVQDIARDIAHLALTAQGKTFAVTISAGVAGCKFSADNGDMPLYAAQMLEAAYGARERAKRWGGNQVVLDETGPAG
ncbi:MAG: diguanylate cyclase [Gammaproteobacteria bacterium]